MPRRACRMRAIDLRSRSIRRMVTNRRELSSTCFPTLCPCCGVILSWDKRRRLANRLRRLCRGPRNSKPPLTTPRSTMSSSSSTSQRSSVAPRHGRSPHSAPRRSSRMRRGPRSAAPAPPNFAPASRRWRLAAATRGRPAREGRSARQERRLSLSLSLCGERGVGLGGGCSRQETPQGRQGLEVTIRRRTLAVQGGPGVAAILPETRHADRDGAAAGAM